MIRDFEVCRDHFEEMRGQVYCFPCYACRHVDGGPNEEPCRSCDHNAGAESFETTHERALRTIAEMHVPANDADANSIQAAAYRARAVARAALGIEDV